VSNRTGSIPAVLDGYQHPPYWQPQPRPPINSKLLRPRAGWYAAIAVPLVLGAAAMAVFVVLAVRAFPDEPKPFLAPGGPELHLEKGKDQTIYSHTRGSGYVSQGTPNCKVKRLPDGPVVRLRNAGPTTLTFGDDGYAAELHFEPPADGDYLIRCEAPPGRHEPLAVGNRPRLAVFGAMVVGAIVSAGLGVLLAVGSGVLVAVLRSRHKRRLQDELMTSPYAPGSPGS
jgi:hypothetical protein